MDICSLTDSEIISQVKISLGVMEQNNDCK